MSLHCKANEVPEYNRTQTGEAGTGQMVVRKGYGNECSLMIATRKPGYHTKPHQHESEQINYVLDGEIWFFVKDKGLSLIHISEPTRLLSISYAVFCLKK